MQSTVKLLIINIIKRIRSAVTSYNIRDSAICLEEEITLGAIAFRVINVLWATVLSI